MLYMAWGRGYKKCGLRRRCTWDDGMYGNGEGDTLGDRGGNIERYVMSEIEKEILMPMGMKVQVVAIDSEKEINLEMEKEIPMGMEKEMQVENGERERDADGAGYGSGDGAMQIEIEMRQMRQMEKEMGMQMGGGGRGWKRCRWGRWCGRWRRSIYVVQMRNMAADGEGNADDGIVNGGTR